MVVIFVEMVNQPHDDMELTYVLTTIIEFKL